MKRRKPKYGPQYHQFKRRNKGRVCSTCHRMGTDPHHIIYRDGKAWDDERNLLWVCRRCHNRLHGHTQVIDGSRIVGWKKEVAERIAMEAKERMEPEHFDPRYLDYLRHFEKHLRETGSMEYQEDV
jgi:hypothetical protein